MKKLYFLFITLILCSLSFGQVINEFEPNPVGTDPANVSFEIKGTPSSSFSGYILSLESDPTSIGNVDRATMVSGIFDSNGLLVVSVPDFENPSFTVVLTDSFTGTLGDDLDTDDNGTIDVTPWTEVYDAIGIPDTTGDEANIYGNQLGGQDFVYTGDEPGLVFRDGTSGVWYAVNDPDNGEVYDINATEVIASGSFNIPANIATFGSTNPIYSVSSCGISLGTVSYTCTSSTIGDGNDTVTVEIPYTGSDATITSVTTTAQGGTVGGDDPATVADGTITITGLLESEAWDITINGGDCDSTTDSGTIPAAECDPTPSTCYDLSAGPEAFELVAITPNNGFTNNGMWTNTSGTYAANAYCGSTCAEPVEGWLIFGPLDMQGVTDLSLVFDALKEYTETPLIIAYTNSYSGCPSGSSWTTAQTLTATGAYSVDLSGAIGTDVYIGVQYADDGVDSYSGWSLSNVELASFGNCPLLGQTTPSDCAVCDLTLETETYTCQSNTAGDNNDGVTVEIPYTGSESSGGTLSTTSGGTVAGDISVVDGTITISGLMEGDTWDLIITGGDCDATTVSGTIPASVCDPITCANPGDIIITEIMQNPSAVADSAGEYFEVYNTTAAPIDMAGWQVFDISNTSETFTIGASLIVTANGYAVLSNNGDFSTNGGVNADYVYPSNFYLGNSSDELRIECSSTVIDEVSWDNGATFPDGNGVAMELATNKYNSTDNDDGSNWALAVSEITSGGDLGTPGAVNDFVLSLGNFETVSFNLYPNPTNTGFVTITSNNSEAIQAQVFDILGKQVLNNTISNNRLNVSSLNAGLYIVKLTQDNASVTKKLIVK